MLQGLYKTAMRLSTPLLESLLQKRTARGKEDPARAHERRGRPALPRPDGMLVWFHAASVGESLSLLSVIDRLLKDYPNARVMVTTGTVTSAKLMAERLPARAFHQYIPVDHPAWVATFLDHWRPDAVVWSESELWPNILSEVKARGIPAALLNARMSEGTFRHWKMARGLAKAMLGAFSFCLAQNAAEAQRLTALGAKNVSVSPNLKYAAAPLPVDEKKLSALRAKLEGRDLVLWASTHPGEEEIALRVHAKLKGDFKNLLTVIVPRHPSRGNDIAALAAGYKTAQRWKSDDPAAAEFYIADTLGELGLFYRLCKNAVIGGTFADIGGHNPIEPAQLGCVIFCGPVTYNFVTITEDFKKENALVPVADENELARELARALADPAAFAPVAEAASRLTARHGNVAGDIMRSLSPLLQKEAGA